VVSIFLIKLILENRHKGEAIAYSLILGGAMGNLIDRVFRGYVVDSFDFYWRDWHWPAFNLADIAIVLGALRVSAACWVKRGRSENGIYGHSRFCNTDFDDKLACLNLSGV
jgi:signal peptidase II